MAYLSANLESFLATGLGPLLIFPATVSETTRKTKKSSIEDDVN
jgi:hypothetical protein